MPNESTDAANVEQRRIAAAGAARLSKKEGDQQDVCVNNALQRKRDR